MKNTLLIITTVAATSILTPAQDLASHLQKGLIEEEINRNPSSAIEHYETLLEEFNKSRKLAATALFRIAECSRKLGDEDAATNNLQKLITLHPKQEKLITLARQNLDTLNVTPTLTDIEKLKTKSGKAQAIIKYKDILRDRPDDIKNSKYLMDSIISGHVEGAQFLLEHGNNPNAKHNRINKPRYPHIDRAVQHANLSIVKLLLKHGADVTPDSLTKCIDYDYPNIETLLLTAIKSKHKNFDYFPALRKSIQRNNEDAFNRLVANGADPKAFGFRDETLLLIAAKYGRSKLCTRLIAAGIDVNYQDFQGNTALHYAVLLAKHGNYLNLRDEYNQALTAKDRAKVVVTLLNAGANKSLKNRHGKTPEQIAKGLEFDTILKVNP